MRINELLVESQQLDEGPFTQAIGKVGGKIAKGVANIGKDLKTGFKAGYSGEQPPADAAATTAPAAAAAPTQAAPVKKPGLLQKIGKAATDYAQGYQQGAEAPVAAAPAAASTNAPAVDPAVEKQSKIGVGQINKIIPTLRTRDLMSLQANLEKTIASKKKVAPAAPEQQAATKPNWDEETGEPLTAKAKAEYATFSPEQKAEIQKNIANKKSSGAKQSVAASQAEIDADRERLLPQNSSIIRTGNSLSETLARKVQAQKQRIFETALVNGRQSIFKNENS